MVRTERQQSAALASSGPTTAVSDCQTRSGNNSSKSAWWRDRWLWREILWIKESFKTNVESAVSKVDKWSRITAWR